MSDLEQEFQKAAEDVKNLSARPTDQELLETYALFKQATVGDCNQPKPAIYALKEKAKHEFWSQKKGKSILGFKIIIFEQSWKLTEIYHLQAPARKTPRKLTLLSVKNWSDLMDWRRKTQSLRIAILGFRYFDFSRISGVWVMKNHEQSDSLRGLNFD